MGTNETFGRRFNTDEFSGQMEAFLALVKKELPNTAILLTTPPECIGESGRVNSERMCVMIIPSGLPVLSGM